MISSILVKPAGPDCNLRCSYCFYRQKTGIFGGKTHRMSDKTLDILLRDAIQSDITTFSWQGGEPTMMGLDFYKSVVEKQMKYGSAPMANALQTNGVLLDGKWARFLAEYGFLVGLSVDGPRRLHDYYRKDARGKGTFDRVMASASLLREHGVDFNVLTLLNNINVAQPDVIYDFLLDNDVYFMQFVPCVEPGPASFSISAEQYGEFLVRIFDRWAEDFPCVSIRDFDDLLMRELGRGPGTCTVSERCGSYFVVEHNGDVFACDFFVVSRWRLGNITQTPLTELAKSEKFEQFAEAKSKLGDECANCRFVRWCYGGCQKHRTALGGKSTGPSYFCEAYKRLFEHALPRMPELVTRLGEC